MTEFNRDMTKARVLIILFVACAAVAVALNGCASNPQGDPNRFRCGDGWYAADKEHCDPRSPVGRASRTWYNPGAGFYDR